MERMLNVDVNITRSCNFDCKYCFAKTPFAEKHEADNITFDHIKTFLESLPDTDFFKDNFDILNIGIWGGEPTLREVMVSDLIDQCDASNVKFMIFSNGFYLSQYMKSILDARKKRTVNVHPKLCIQVSYDGNPIHDMYRVSKISPLHTSNKIKENIKFLSKNEIPFVLKSTITPESFKYLYDAYCDFRELNDELTGYGFKNTNYFPTIDYYNPINYTDEELEILCQDLKKSLIKIAKKEYMHIYPIFKWFEHNRALCSAGRDMMAIDIDGWIYNCHGCFYDENKSDHLIGNVKDINIIDKLQSNYIKFNYKKHDEGDCKKCPVTFCLRCNHAKYINSEKTKYLDKWRDFTAQPQLCEFYKINHKVKLAYDLLRGE